MSQTHHDIFTGIFFFEQIELLEHHGGISPHVQNILFSRIFHIEGNTIQLHLSCIRMLQKIDAPQKSGFSRS